MEKCIITADLHIFSHRGDQRRIEDGLQCLQWIYNLASDRQIKNVIIAGDLMHNRFSLSVYAYSKALKIIADAKEKGINTTFLLGNHDMFSEDDWNIHSLTPIREWATVVDKPTTINIGGLPMDFLPYTPRPSRYLPGFEKPSKVLITHLAIADAVLNTKYDIKSVEDDSKEKEVISASAFRKWEKVFMGHYHYGQHVCDNVEYIGSPMQLSFGEAGQKKHVIVLNLETLETEYIENTISPRFHIVDSETPLVDKDLSNAYIQMRGDSEIESKFELKKSLAKLGAREIEFVPVNKIEASPDSTQQALSNINEFFNNKNKLVEKYVDGVDTGDLDKEILKKIGMEIVG